MFRKDLIFGGGKQKDDLGWFRGGWGSGNPLNWMTSCINSPNTLTSYHLSGIFMCACHIRMCTAAHVAKSTCDIIKKVVFENLHL